MLMQLFAADKAATFNPRKSSPEKRERGKLSRIQQACHLHRTLVKVGSPKKRHKSKPGVWLSPRCNLMALLGHCLALRVFLCGKSLSETKASKKSA